MTGTNFLIFRDLAESLALGQRISFVRLAAYVMQMHLKSLWRASSLIKRCILDKDGNKLSDCFSVSWVGSKMPFGCVNYY
jgi:hypothetical protein